MRSDPIPSQTVVALEDCVLMNFAAPEHIEAFKEVHDQNIQEKVQVLGSIPSYALCTQENLVSTTHHTHSSGLSERLMTVGRFV